MKQTILFTALMISLTSFAASSETIELNTDNAVCSVEIGVSITEAIDLVKENYYVEKAEMPGYEGEHFEYIVYSDTSKSNALYSFSADTDNQTKNKDKVFRITIKNTNYKTVDGITVGMRIKDIKEKAQLVSVDYSYKNGLFIISNTFNGGYLMGIYPLIESNYNYEQPSIETLPENLEIKEIVMF